MAAMLARLAAAALVVSLAQADVERALSVARGSERERAAFHAAYIVKPDEPFVEELEIITEFRRIVLLGEDHLKRGDWMFTQGVLAATRAAEPWHGRVVLIAHVRFHPQNMYVSVPAVEIHLGPTAEGPAVLPVDSKTTGVWATPAKGQEKTGQPILGAIGESAFDAALVGQGKRDASVLLDGKDILNRPIAVDFTKLQ